MPRSCPLHAAFAATSSSRAVRLRARGASRDHSPTLAERCLRVIGWHRLERLLASIPDSNDDFGIV
ncbi:hypothetical protein [Burkholderia vietnamiensis]|uniref:hypothetical protein n=1 Tax=Burkholderia vietnamiensis TaxID=60552 RepID=UPI001B921F0A|nr:hypothetical protein [Burkholderia vietnamiensis]MBR8003961.1 hypothetical protein [Burkholderia vietnamiensis]